MNMENVSVILLFNYSVPLLCCVEVESQIERVVFDRSNLFAQQAFLNVLQKKPFLIEFHKNIFIVNGITTHIGEKELLTLKMEIIYRIL